MKLSGRSIWQFIRLSRPLQLLGGLLLYGLGAAMAFFLGNPLNPGLYLFGQGMITSLQLMGTYLDEFYDPPRSAEDTSRTPSNDKTDVPESEVLPRQAALYAAIASLVLAATLVSVKLAQGDLTLIAWLILALIFLGLFFHSTPPLQLVTSGYGELTTSLVVAGLIPAFAFALHSGGMHRLVPMSTTPLIALHFAMMITSELPDYASNLKHYRRTLMIRVGWATAMRLHDAAILFAILSFGIAFLYGLPRRVVFGSLIALPLAIAQIWQMDRIRRGYPARWRTLTFSSFGLFGLTVYLGLIGYFLY